MNINWKEFISLGSAVLTVAAALYLGLSGAIQWDVALPIMLAGLGILGIHPTFNTNPVAGRIR